MTISTLNSSNTFFGNGATTVFVCNYVPDSAADIQVVLTDSNGQQTTIPQSAYLVAINPILPGSLWATSFTVTYPISGSPLPSGSSLTISRVLPLTQEADISNQGNQYPTVTEQALDTLEMQIQQVSARTGQIRGTWLTTTLYNFGDIVIDGVNGADTGNLYANAIPGISGVWADDLANGNWSLALNVQSIVNALPSIGNNQVFGNITGGGTPVGVGVSALLDSALGSAQGDILYRSASGWSVLPPGTSGQVLSTQGAAANPQWVAGGGGSGSVTNVATGAGLIGGPITTTGTVALATVADKSLLANISGGTLAPSATTLSALLDNILGNTQGSVIYRGGTLWSVLPPGTNGQVLQTQGAGANPIWANQSSGATLSWTPTLNFGGSSAGITYVTQVGSYIQIGKFVIAQFWLGLTSKGSASGAATVTGIPVVAAGPGNATVIITGYQNMNGPGSFAPAIAGSTIYVTYAGATGQFNITDANFNNNTLFQGSAIYIAA